MYYSGLKGVCENPLIGLGLISGFAAAPGLMYPIGRVVRAFTWIIHLFR
jgi:hypothetical protein